MAEIKTLAWIQATPGEQLPPRMGRFTKRKDESSAAWKMRLEMLYQAGSLAPKDDTQKPRIEALYTYPTYVREVLKKAGFDEQAQLFLSRPADTPRLVAFRNRSQQQDTEADGTEELRGYMAAWVEQTYTAKFGEARCDLACARCPGPMVLACGSENITPLVMDEHTQAVRLLLEGT